MTTQQTSTATDLETALSAAAEQIHSIDSWASLCRTEVSHHKGTLNESRYSQKLERAIAANDPAMIAGHVRAQKALRLSYWSWRLAFVGALVSFHDATAQYYAKWTSVDEVPVQYLVPYRGILFQPKHGHRSFQFDNPKVDALTEDATAGGASEALNEAYESALRHEWLADNPYLSYSIFAGGHMPLTFVDVGGDEAVVGSYLRRELETALSLNGKQWLGSVKANFQGNFEKLNEPQYEQRRSQAETIPQIEELDNEQGEKRHYLVASFEELDRRMELLSGFHWKLQPFMSMHHAGYSPTCQTGPRAELTAAASKNNFLAAVLYSELIERVLNDWRTAKRDKYLPLVAKLRPLLKEHAISVRSAWMSEFSELLSAFSLGGITKLV